MTQTNIHKQPFRASVVWVLDSFRISLTVVLMAGILTSGRAAEPLTFERDVLPILNSHCLQCHGGLHRNPLFGAIHGGHTDVAKLLIESGIDTAANYTGENMTNMDALAFAKEWGRSEIVALLEATSR